MSSDNTSTSSEQSITTQTTQTTPPVNGESKDPYAKFQLEWQEYYANLGNDKQHWITKLAPQDEFTIEFEDGKKVKYRRKKIGIRDYATVERLRTEWRKTTDPNADVVELMINMYETLASFCLINDKTGKPITRKEIEGPPQAVWEDEPDQPGIKTILDAVFHRAVLGLAYFQPKPGSAVQ